MAHRTSIASEALSPILKRQSMSGLSALGLGRTPPRGSIAQPRGSVFYTGALSTAGDDENDAVLIKCRDAIEKLHEELEEERNRRRELQRQVNTSESEVLQLQNEIELESGKRADFEGRTARLEKQLADCETKLEAAGKLRETAAEDLQKTKAEATQRAQDLFAQELKTQEMEHALHRSESRLSSTEADVKHLNKELSTAAERLGAEEREKVQLQMKLQVETDRCERLSRQVKEQESQLTAARKDTEELQRTISRMEEEHEEQLLQAKSREEKHAAKSKEKEAELERNLKERINEAKQEAAELSKEVESWKVQVRELEKELAREKVQAESLRAELTSVKAEQKKFHADHESSLQQIHGQNIELVQLKAACDASLEKMQHLSHERQEAQDRHLETSSESAQLRKQLDECQKLLAERSQELHQQQEMHVHRQHQFELQSKHEVQTLKEQSESDLQKVCMEVAELRIQCKFDEERRADLQLQNQKTTEDKEHCLRRIAAMQAKLEETTCELKSEQEKTKETTSNVVQMRHALRQSEDEVDALQEQLIQAQRQLEGLQQESSTRMAAVMAEKDSRTGDLERKLAKCQERIEEVEFRAEKNLKHKQEKQRNSYEEKLSKMHRQLAERESYEARLKSLIENEVNTIHRYNVDMDPSADRFSRAQRGVSLGQRRRIKDMRPWDDWDEDY